MPKIVDHDEQRKVFTDAAMRLIARQGFEAVTMRKVASEAGLSYGSLFHYFDSKDDLLRHAIRRSTTEQGQRVNGFTSRYKGLKALEQLISDDSLVTDSSRDAWMLWQAFLYRSSLQESFADLHNELIEGWVKRFRTILEEARDMGEVSDTLDCEKEAWALEYRHGFSNSRRVHPLNELLCP